MPSLRRGNHGRTYCVPQGVRRYAGQASLLDDLLPWRFVAPEIAVALSGGENEFRIVGALNRLEYGDRSRPDRPHRFTGL